MVAIARSKRRSTRTPRWHARFLKMLPLIRRIARFSFRPHLHADDYDDAVQEVVANAMVAFARLVEQGRGHTAKASPLARYAIRQYWEGRRTQRTQRSRCDV